MRRVLAVGFLLLLVGGLAISTYAADPPLATVKKVLSDTAPDDYFLIVDSGDSTVQLGSLTLKALAQDLEKGSKPDEKIKIPKIKVSVISGKKNTILVITKKLTDENVATIKSALQIE